MKVRVLELDTLTSKCSQGIEESQLVDGLTFAALPSVTLRDSRPEKRLESAAGSLLGIALAVAVAAG